MCMSVCACVENSTPSFFSTLGASDVPFFQFFSRYFGVGGDSLVDNALPDILSIERVVSIVVMGAHGVCHLVEAKEGAHFRSHHSPVVAIRFFALITSRRRSLNSWSLWKNATH